MPVYNVNVKLVTDGKFKIVAKSEEEAKHIIETEFYGCVD